MSNEKYDIYPRIYSFVIEVVNFTKKIPLSLQNTPMISQLVRSATSMGANSREADGALTKNDFVNKFSIVRKEGKETDYWLQILGDLNQELSSEAIRLRNECTEITKIVSAIMAKSRA